jgi:DNA-binding winged helix-turn-helix (wHTH) protein
VIRYRFDRFTLSPQQRRLLRDGQELQLIPRYFDLLLLLVERRHEAVHRREIFERVWPDVTVSDSALSQAIRILRRTLDDDSKEPRFIRTVSRHGYRFVLAEVIEEHDDGPAVPPARVTLSSAPAPAVAAPLWSGAAFGGAVAGVVSGIVGGGLLALAPGSTSPPAIAPVLAVIGGACGALGGGGVGLGLSVADAQPGLPHLPPTVGRIIGGAAGGGLVGAAVQWLAWWSLSALVGIDAQIGGGIEGVVIGAAAGGAYTLASGRMAVTQSLLVAAALCGIAGVVLQLLGRPLVGGTIHAIATAAEGSQATLEPLGRLIGEADFGPITRALLAFGEGATFGAGLAWGLFRDRR